MIHKKTEQAAMDGISANPGTYALVLSLQDGRSFGVGKLGDIQFTPGWYVYVGSAMGPGGLAARVGRHLKQRKRRHWHVDYLRSVAQVVGFFWRMGTRKKECRWASLLKRKPFFGVPVRGFGCSDCTCDAHLFYFPQSPDWERIRRRLKANWDTGARVETLEFPFNRFC